MFLILVTILMMANLGCYSDNSGNHLVHSIPCPRQSWIPTLKTEFDAFFSFCFTFLNFVDGEDDNNDGDSDADDDDCIAFC